MADTNKRSEQERRWRDEPGATHRPGPVTRPEVDRWLADLQISVDSLNSTSVDKLRGRINSITSIIKTFRERLGIHQAGSQ